MLKRLVKVVSATMAFFMFAGVFAGCGKKEEAKPAEQGASTAQASGPVYPIKTNVTLKYWVLMHPNISTVVKNMGETPYSKEMEKRTGVKVEYIHPPVGQEKESFNILLASGDLPDIIEYKWMEHFPGGLPNALNSGLIVKLNDVMDKYTPNYKSYLKANPEVDRQVKTDDGSYLMFPFIRSSKELQQTSGPMVRKDWLDDLKLPAPETIDDWYGMLKAFKDQKGATAPVIARTTDNVTQIYELFCPGFGFWKDFYQDNGKIKYGPAEPGFKDFIETMAKWYKEGLIDKNFATTDRKAQDSAMTTGKAGATYGAGGGNMGVYIPTGKEKDPKYDITAVKFPVAKKGETPKFGRTSFELTVDGSAVISKTSKNLEVAAKFLDYSYSKEGILFQNFGIEGETYKMVDGKPTYTDTIMKNPNKLTTAQALTMHTRGNTAGPLVQDPGYILQYYELPQQKDALLKFWTVNEFKKSFMPPVSYTKEESSEIAKIKTEADTFANEYMLKVIMGSANTANHDQFVAQLKKMNIDKAVANVQAALDRYNKR